MIEQIENRNSALREELVETKEYLNKALLERDCLHQQQGETSDALNKSELQNADLGGYLLHFQPRRGFFTPGRSIITELKIAPLTLLVYCYHQKTYQRLILCNIFCLRVG